MFPHLQNEIHRHGRLILQGISERGYACLTCFSNLAKQLLLTQSYLLMSNSVWRYLGRGASGLWLRRTMKVRGNTSMVELRQFHKPTFIPQCTVRTTDIWRLTCMRNKETTNLDAHGSVFCMRFRLHMILHCDRRHPPLPHPPTHPNTHTHTHI